MEGAGLLIMKTEDELRSEYDLSKLKGGIKGKYVERYRRNRMPLAYGKIIELVSKYLPHPQAVELNKWIDQLRKENQELSDEVKKLKKRVEDLGMPKGLQPEGVPQCPNCSTEGRPFYMSPIPPNFAHLKGATYQCTNCRFKQ